MVMLGSRASAALHRVTRAVLAHALMNPCTAVCEPVGCTVCYRAGLPLTAARTPGAVALMGVPYQTFLRVGAKKLNGAWSIR